ncbi:M20/M25/M40 family metallo-hydrolase [Streptomyces sp. NPDC127098]|uniref:M20/M25/M40 family metallo-hydrolase n=1 Tax=Streptomyces sp. NPDC127098 TaxID=3347137 RepID=UPI00366846ED
MADRIASAGMTGARVDARHIDDRADDEVVRFTADLIRHDTTNRGGGDGVERPAAEYVAAALADAGIEPVIVEKAAGRTNVVARVAGTDPGADALLVHGHLDVVPADASEWSVPPFAGEVVDDVVWGRGAVDMKGSDAMVLTVVRAWARAGVRPRRDIVLAFTADEEDSAEFGAGHLVRLRPELFEGCTEAIGESGAYTYHPGDGRRIYPVGAGERGTSWLALTARGRAGHGSKINRENAVTRLSAAVTRIGEHTWPVRLSPTVRAALTELAALYEQPLPDLDTPDPDELARGVEELLDRLGPAAALVAGTVRNSANPTMLDAGYKVNVIPGSATAHVDGRVLPGGDEEFTTTLDLLTGPDVDWEYAHHEIPLQAPVDAPTFDVLRAALRHFDADAHVVPYCMTGGTDAKQFSRLGVTGYGFMPLRLPEGFDYQAMFHGVDERVPVSALRFGIRVLDRALLTL